MAKQQKKAAGDGRKIVASNRKARHDYTILETYECGIVLMGSEVKSLRDSQVQIKDGYADVRKGEMWLNSVHIAPYAFSRDGGHEPERRRKLLMHGREIGKINARIREERLTLVPLSIYFRNGLCKVELGLAKGRNTIDKRRAIKDRDIKREMQRATGTKRY